MTKEFDHVAAIIDDRRAAIQLLKRAISELELAEVPAIVAQLETAMLGLRDLTPGGDKPRRKYSATRITAANDTGDACAFGHRLRGMIQGGGY